MYKHISETFNNISLRIKLLTILIGFSTITYLMLLICVDIITIKYNQQIDREMSIILEMLVDDIEEKLMDYSKITEFIISDKLIQKQLMNLNEEYSIDSAKQLNSSLYKYYNQEVCIEYIGIETGKTKVAVGVNISEENEPVREEIVREARKANGKEVWIPLEGENSYLMCARQIRQTQNLDLKELGIVTIKVNLDQLINKYKGRIKYYEHPLQITISDNGGLIYPNQQVTLNQKTNAKEKYFENYTKGKYQDWQYILAIPFKEIWGTLNVLKGGTLFICIVLIGGCTAFVNKMLGNIISHIDILVSKIQFFTNNPREVLPTKYNYKKRGDEIGFLHNQFDEMTKELNTLIDENYTKQLLIKEAEFKNLQKQINPHFLFNTLNSINWIAKANGQEEIVKMITALGSLLRYSMKYEGDFIEISLELDIIDKYMQIQEFRYGDRLIFEKQIDECLLGIKIPKMSIQPLVENAIKYGLENSIEEFEVKIIVKEDGECIFIQVIDNGEGMPVKTLEEFKEKQDLVKGTGIGLVNIDKRIKLMFSDTYGLTIKPNQQGACIEIKIPKEKIEEY